MGKYHCRIEITVPFFSHPVNYDENGYVSRCMMNNIFVSGGLKDLDPSRIEEGKANYDPDVIRDIKEKILQSPEWKYAIDAYDIDPGSRLELGVEIDTMRVDISQFESMNLDKAVLSAIESADQRGVKLVSQYMREDAMNNMYRPTAYTVIPIGTSLDEGTRNLDCVIASYPLNRDSDCRLLPANDKSPLFAGRPSVQRRHIPLSHPSD